MYIMISSMMTPRSLLISAAANFGFRYISDRIANVLFKCSAEIRA